MLPGPVFNVELITTARRARYYAIRFLYGMILLFFVLQSVTGQWQPHRGREAALWTGGELTISELAEVGRSIFSTITILQGITVLVLTPAMVAGVVADEKRRKTLHYLMASRLTSAEIILGKLLARLLHVGVFLAVGLPVLSLVSLFGGVEPLGVVLMYAATASTACFLGALSILVSTFSRRPREANSQVYILGIAWLFCPSLIAWLMPMAGGIWGQVYEWVRPVNELVRWSSPMSMTGSFPGSDPVEACLWMIGLQSAYAVAFVVLSILALRPMFRRDGEGPRRLGWLFDAQRRRRFLPRPGVGDDAMLWKERYVSRTSGVVKVAAAFIMLGVVAALGYATERYATPAFVELWNHGYGASGNYDDRLSFNVYLRTVCTILYVTWCLGAASLAAAGIVGEREEDTWTSLITTPLEGTEILRAKMLGAVWGTRWLGFLLLAFWLLGLAAGSVHPLAFAVVVLETAVFLWFVVALGTFFSLRATTSARAQTATMAVLLVLNGVYLFCCIPLQPNGMFFALGVTPMIEALSLFNYRDLDSALNPSYAYSRQGEAILTCGAGVLSYGAAALVLTIESFTSFDVRVDRPRRGPGRRVPPLAVRKDGDAEFDEGIEFLDD
jgi:ABC-type transport system involved in multi-copper enzyme maturation permease subunit